MRAAILTLYEGHYHYGVAALINSSLAIGFRGRFLVGYRDALPPWVAALQKVEANEYSIEGVRITFFNENPPRHLGFQKPFAALSVFERFPEIETIYYADPDITLLAPWEFFDKWAAQGVGVVGDINFGKIGRNHPWRKEWEALLKQANAEIRNITDKSYPNSGFFILNRSDCDLARLWSDLTLRFEQAGGNTHEFQMDKRWEAIVGDQDLLAAALLGWSAPVAMLGPEAMGFTGYFFILSHAIESPKPWAKSYLKHALRGWPPTQAAKRYLQFFNHPIQVESKIRMLLRKLDFKSAQLISRFYHRPVSR